MVGRGFIDPVQANLKRVLGTGEPSRNTILLVEDDEGDACLVREVLGETETEFVLVHHRRLDTAIRHLAEGTIDLVLLDLGLPDSQGLQTIRRVRERDLEVPIVVLTGLHDESVGVRAVIEGAQDYLVKDQLGNSQLLVRAIRYAIERQYILLEFQRRSFHDPLTGLHNRRGFMTLAQQQLRLARRKKNGFVVIVADVDGLKLINDNYGHLRGDRTLVQIATILKSTFRESDIISRIGGDEFAVLCIDASPDDSDTMISRLKDHVETYNAGRKEDYTLSLSLGTAYFDPKRWNSKHDLVLLENLVGLADQALYDEKRMKHCHKSDQLDG